MYIYLKHIIKSILGEKRYNSLRKNKILSDFAKIDDNIKYKINNNNRFKDIHKNQRCFILGNGPSLKDVDLALLSNEIVFSVNNFCKVKDFKNAKTNYHFWIDDAFFNLRKDMKYNMNNIMKNYSLMSEENAECFVPISALKFIKDNKLDEKLNINYLINGIPFEAFKLDEFDICSIIPSFTTVVQYCIIVAIYMGFNEIYLLGCDSTGIVATINCALNQKNKDMHAYGNDNTENEINGLLKHWNMSKVFFDQYLLFKGYEYLNDICNNKNIILKNCSEKSLINSIKTASINEALEN